MPPAKLDQVSVQPVQEVLPELIEWRPVAMAPDYEISESGDIRRATAAGYRPAGRLLEPWIHPKGYRRFELWTDGRKVRRYAHQLVAIAFLGDAPTPRHEVAHRDGVPGHDHWSNLRWATRKENNSDRLLHGTDQWGERNPSAKLTSQDAARIRERVLFGASIRQTGRLFGIHHATVGAIIRGDTWR